MTDTPAPTQNMPIGTALRLLADLIDEAETTPYAVAVALTSGADIVANLPGAYVDTDTTTKDSGYIRADLGDVKVMVWADLSAIADKVATSTVEVVEWRLRTAVSA